MILFSLFSISSYDVLALQIVYDLSRAILG